MPREHRPRFYSAEEGAETIAHLCDKPRLHGASWQACCPAHEDRTPSLSITPRGERILLHCHAGCDTRAIVGALGLELRDLFAGPPPLPPLRRPRARPSTPPAGPANGAASATAPANGAASATAPPSAPPPAGPPQVTATYDYFDAHGTLLFQVQRFEPGFHGRAKDFRQRRPTGRGGWINNLTGVTRALYHLPEVLAAVAAGQILYLPEGEKDADRLRALGLTATTNAGGAAKWEPQYTETLRGAHVVILQDNDPPGAKHTARLTQELHGGAASLKVVAFPELPAHGDVSDWLDAGHTRDELDVRVAATPLWQPAATAPVRARADAAEAAAADERPVITQAAHELPTVVTQALAALATLPDGPRLFQRAGQLYRIAPAPPHAAGLQRPTWTPSLQPLTAITLRHLLAQAAHWHTPTPSGSYAYPDKPAAWLVDTLLELGTWDGLPPLTGLLSVPTLRPDGSLLTTPGYDAATGLYLPDGLAWPALPEAPDWDAARQAATILAEPFGDFPFEAPHHRSAVLAAILSLLARYAVEHVPLFAIRATTRGSGKTLLADAISVIATGRPAAKMPPARDEDEERKRLLALALDGDPLVLIDNVTGALGTPALDVALTSLTFKDRLLGKNTTKEAPLETVFLATGNQMSFRGDTARRVVPIDLLPEVERPEERTGFAHPKLLAYVARQRPTLVAAALTILRAYVVDGRPPQGLTPYGSFEAWSDLIRSALVWCDQPDPCLGRVGLEASSDAGYEGLAELLAAWHACYGEKPTTLKTVFRHLTMYAGESEYERLQEALDGFCDTGIHEKKVSLRHVGHALKKVEKRIVNHQRFEKKGDKGRDGQEWFVKML